MKNLFKTDYLECFIDEDSLVLFHAWLRKPTSKEFREGLKENILHSDTYFLRHTNSEVARISSDIMSVKYEASPLNRPLQLFGPGANWRLNPTSEKPQTISYEVADNVPMYSSSGNSIIKGNENFLANNLLLTRNKDEKGNETISIRFRLTQPATYANESNSPILPVDGIVSDGLELTLVTC